MNPSIASEGLYPGRPVFGGAIWPAEVPPVVVSHEGHLIRAESVHLALFLHQAPTAGGHPAVYSLTPAAFPDQAVGWTLTLDGIVWHAPRDEVLVPWSEVTEQVYDVTGELANLRIPARTIWPGASEDRTLLIVDGSGMHAIGQSIAKVSTNDLVE